MRMKRIFLLSIILFCIFTQCKKPGESEKPEVPVAPTNLEVKVISSTAIQLSWSDNSNNEEGFKIERKTGSEAYKALHTTGANVETYNDNDLNPNNKYNYRIYAFNAAGGSTNSSNEASAKTDSIKLVPTVTTTPVSSITIGTALSGGNVESDGGSVIISRGVVWSTSPNPTVTLSTKTSDTTTSSKHISSISGLTINTTYYVKAYATNSIGTGYGTQLIFKTLSSTLPEFSESPMTIDSITDRSAVAHVPSLVNDGGSKISARGVVWGLQPLADISSPGKTSNGSGLGSFNSNMTGLAVGAYYFVRAYATNSSGTSYGPELGFRVSSFGLPYCSDTISSAPVGSTTATIWIGKLNGEGSAALISRGIIWSTIQNPTVSLPTKASSTDRGWLKFDITGLVSKQTYFVREFATNQFGTSYGGEITIKTGAIQQNAVIGDAYGGGTVFYTLKPGDIGYDPNINHGLIAYNEDARFMGEYSYQFKYPWGDTINTKATDISIGKGKMNTDIMINIIGTGYNYSALGAKNGNFGGNGYNDWYLPSINELKQIYSARKYIYNLNNSIYWSSSEVNNLTAFSLDFNSGNEKILHKSGGYFVRAIRSF